MALTTQRSDFTEVKMKAEDLKSTYEASEDRIEEQQIKMLDIEAKYKAEQNRIEQKYEEKLGMLLRKESTVETEHENYLNNELVERLEEQRTIMELQRDEILSLQKKVSELQNGKTKVKTKVERPKLGTSYHEEYSEEEEDSDSEFDFNDSFMDPDWVKTPMAKQRRARGQATSQLLKDSVTNGIDMSAGGLLGDISEASTSGRSNKRSNSFASSCKCKGSCATKQCGCVKENNFCSNNCKCTSACVNNEAQQQSKENGDGDGAAAEVKDHEVTPPAAKRNK